MNPTETFPHRRARDERYRHYCACGDSVPEEMFKGVGSPLSPSYTWGSDCPAALREALAWQEDRHGTRAEQEREEADLAAEMAAVEAMSDDEINASLDAAGVDRALADRKCDALVRVCVERLALVMKLEKAEKERDAALARVAELEATLANERGEGDPPVPGWRTLRRAGEARWVLHNERPGRVVDVVRQMSDTPRTIVSHWWDREVDADGTVIVTHSEGEARTMRAAMRAAFEALAARSSAGGAS